MTRLGELGVTSSETAPLVARVLVRLGAVVLRMIDRSREHEERAITDRLSMVVVRELGVAGFIREAAGYLSLCPARTPGGEADSGLGYLAARTAALYRAGFVQEALRESSAAKKRFQDTTAWESRDMVVLLQTIMGCQWTSGEFYPAAETAGEALLLARRVLGPDHPVSVAVEANIASTRHSMGHVQEAMRLYIDCRERMERVLGKDHPEYLSTLKNLGVCYRSIGKLGEAVECF